MSDEMSTAQMLRLADEYRVLGRDAEASGKPDDPEERRRFIATCRSLERRWRSEAEGGDSK